MKEATGELSMTVVVIVAVIAILGILTAFLLPQMSNYIGRVWNQNQNGTNCITNPTTGRVECN